MFCEEKLWIYADSLTFYNINDKMSNDYIHENSDFGSHAESSIAHENQKISENRKWD